MRYCAQGHPGCLYIGDAQHEPQPVCSASPYGGTADWDPKLFFRQIPPPLNPRDLPKIRLVDEERVREIVREEIRGALRNLARKLVRR